MTYAHHAPAPASARPLELELAEIRGEYEARGKADLSRAARLAGNWPRWQQQRNTSLRDMLLNACPDFEQKEGTYYRHFYAGVGQNAGFTGTMSDLEPFGWALHTAGKTLADLRALTARDGEDATRKALRQERSKQSRESTTVRRLVEADAATLDRVGDEVGEVPGAPVRDVDRRSLGVRVLGNMPRALRTVAVKAELGDADAKTAYENLAHAIEHGQPDFYEELKRGGCAVPGCFTSTGIELHHMAHGEQTKRGGDLVIPVCRFHHNQDGSHDHAHAMTRDAFYALWGGEVPFLWAVWERYAQAAQAVRRKA